MAADERLIGLQKAYADIILNSAKEAATRIMMSEKKAQRFQRELEMAKDESLRMFLRLKQMMDSKISELELTSVNERMKIEELEAQLQEAEDIVEDLREELREVQSELEWVRNSKVQHQIGEMSEENRHHSSESVVLHPPESEFEYLVAADTRNSDRLQRNVCHKFYRSIPNIGNAYTGFPDLPSIILRSKEPELYRNGCTQRIRASEGNLLGKELCLSGKITKKNDEISAGENGSANEIFPAPTTGTENPRNSKKKVQSADGWLGNWKPMQSFSVKRKRANRYRNRFTSSRDLSDQIVRTDQESDASCLKAHPRPARTDFDVDVGASQLSQRLSSDKSEIAQATRPEVSENETDAELVESHDDGNSVNDKVVTEKSAHARKEDGCIESPTFPVGETNVEKGSVLSPISQSHNVAHDSHSQPINERIIKYTFQRKRKRESVNESNGSTSLENETSKTQALDKQHDTLEHEKLDLVTESS